MTDFWSQVYWKTNLTIGFTGTQNGMTDKQIEECYLFLVEATRIYNTNQLMVVHGACVGADHQFDSIAKEFNIVRGYYPSNIQRKQAKLESGAMALGMPDTPLQRNHLIVAASQIILAAPKESSEVLRSGTWATIRYARKSNKLLKIFEPV